MAHCVLCEVVPVPSGLNLASLAKTQLTSLSIFSERGDSVKSKVEALNLEKIVKEDAAPKSNFVLIVFKKGQICQ